MSNESEKKSRDYKYDIVEEPSEAPGLGVRHFQAVLMLLCILISYCIRTSLSIAIVAMTNPTSENDNVMVYSWDKKVQSLILSSFFLGYLLLQFPAGILATKFGGKMLLISSIGVNGLLNLIFPWVVSVGGWKALMVIRVLQGLLQGSIFPATNTLLGKWAPLNERSRIANLVYAGPPLGTVLAMPISGYLSASSLGWPSIFYLFGGLGVAMALILMYYASDSPREHKFISKNERKYIESSLGVYEEKTEQQDYSKMKTPWISIFTSVPLLAICISHIGLEYGFLTLLLETPTYLKEVHGIDMRNSGLLTALPYVAMWLVMMFGSFLADWVVNKNIMSLTDVRKVANTIGSVCPAVALLILCMVPHDQTALAVFIIIFAIGSAGASSCGALINHIDLSPNFAGITFGMTNTIANVLGLIAPNVVGYVVSESIDPSEWNTVFYIVVGVYFISNLFYIGFASAEKQSWDDPVYTEVEKNSK